MRRLTTGALLGAALLATFAFAQIGMAAKQGSANLRITKSDSPDPVRVGSNLTYTLGVENLGPDQATGVTVTDNLPKGVDLVSATGPAGGCSVQGAKVTCSLGSLEPTGVNYGSAGVTATIVVVPRTSGTIRNTATVKGDRKDPASGNNKATASTRVLGAPTCRGVAATISGTAGDDELLGTTGPDVIVALGGNDRIVSRAGRDLICANAGRDHVGAGTAADRLFGGAGNDRLKGGGGPDRLRGGRGTDVCRGGRGADSLRSCER